MAWFIRGVCLIGVCLNRDLVEQIISTIVVLSERIFDIDVAVWKVLFDLETGMVRNVKMKNVHKMKNKNQFTNNRLVENKSGIINLILMF